MLPSADAPIFGRWQALDAKPLYESRMSQVWRVREASDPAGPTYALKVMKWPKASTSSAYRRFAREADALARLAAAHPSIMPLVDRGEVPDDAGRGRVFLVMPLYPATLARAAKGLPGNADYALTKLIAVAEALEAAHAGGVIHRDVKPENVLLDGDEQRVVLGDFGICLLDEEDRFTHTENHTLGTAHFVAPELMGGGMIEDVVATADVYSVGKTLYAVLTAGEVYPGSRHRDARYDLVRRFGDPRLAHVHGALDLLTAEDPAERPQSMAEARALLGRVREAIRENVAYADGLYRSGPTAEWRGLRLRDVIQRAPATDLARRDATREALETAVRAVELAAEAFGRGPGVGRAGGTGAATADARVDAQVRRAVDEVLAVALPLLRAEDPAMEDVQATVLRWLAVDDHEPVGAAAFLRAVASIAMQATAAAAWRWQRATTLGWAVGWMEARSAEFFYLAPFDGRASLSAAAVHRTLWTSPVVSRLAPDVRDAPRAEVPLGPDGGADPAHDPGPPATLRCVAGLVAMRGVWFYRVATLTTELEAGEQPHFLDWPAFQFAYRAWIDELPEALRRSPTWERQVAGTVLGTDVPSLRKYWAANGLVIARVFARAAAVRGRSAGLWRRDRLSDAWQAWTTTS